MLKKLWNFWKSTGHSDIETENEKPEQAEEMSHSDVSEQLVAEIVEKREILSPLSIATYRDLLNLDRNRPLPTESEYPPLPRRIKAISIDEIMAIYADPIRQAADDLPMSEEEIDAYFMPIVRHALTYMHLLPASQFNHHNGIGGLFAHSLQVGSTALQIGKRKVFNRRDTPRQLHNNGKRWLFGCWLSGFLHDIGKPATDVIVTADGETWYANAENLTQWLALNNKTEYSFIWKSGGHHKHQQSTLFFVREIVSPDTFAWLAAYGSREIWDACENALTNPDYTGPNSLVAEVVKQADQIVSGEDIKQRNTGVIDSRRMGGGLPAAEFILDAIRLLLSEKMIEPNAKGSFFFITNIGSFLIWSTSTADRIYARVLEDKHTSVPKQIDRMLDCLVGGGVLEPAPEEISPAARYYWPLIVDSYPSKVFRAVKLRSNFSIFNGMVAPEPCLAIINGFSGNPPEVLEAWEAKHGKMLSDKAVARDAEEIPPGPMPLTVVETEQNDGTDAAYEEYVRENMAPHSQALAIEFSKPTLSADPNEKTTEDFKSELLQFLLVPDDEKDVEVKPLVDEPSPPPDISVLAPPTDCESDSVEPSRITTVVKNEKSDEKTEPKVEKAPADKAEDQQLRERTMLDSPLLSSPAELSVFVPSSVIPVMALEHAEENKRALITVLAAPQETADSPLPSSSGEDKKENERGIEADDRLLDDAVINEAVFKTTPVENEKSYGTKDIAEKRAKALKTIEAKAEADAERTPVVINEKATVLVSAEGVVCAEEKDRTTLPQPCAAVSKPSSHALSSVDPQSWSLTKKLSYLREEIIRGLLDESQVWFPEGVMRISDTEFQGCADKLFERASQLGLDRVKVKKLQTGFQPDSWKISFSEQAHQLIVTIRKK